jgi:type IV secretion system protein VirB11
MSGKEQPAPLTVVDSHHERSQTAMVDSRLERSQTKIKRELGVVAKYLEDPEVCEVMLNPDSRLWIEKFGQPMEHVGFVSAGQAEALMSTVAATMRTTITRENPILECELPLDGSRFEALIPPIVSAPTFTLRKKAVKVFTLADYVASGVMTARQMDVLEQAIRERKNILVVGGTGSGKTTLCNAIIDGVSRITPEHRVVVGEDTSEIQCTAENVVFLRTSDTVDMLRLLKVTMRLRPDRIVIGECRGGEALALLKAWNTGHDGGVATVHANSARAGLIRMEQLIAEVIATPMQNLIAEAVDLVVFIRKTTQGRRVEEIVSVEGYTSAGYIFQTME